MYISLILKKKKKKITYLNGDGCFSGNSAIGEYDIVGASSTISVSASAPDA